MLKKIRHIGMMVEDVDRAVRRFEGFGLICNELIEQKEDGKKLAFFPVGDTLIEFLSYSPDKAWDPSGIVVRSQKGPINHICFEVDDLVAAILDFEKTAAKLVEGTPRPGAHGQVAFFYPETTEGVLIELCEVKTQRL
jgi:methylmalonyl-CoA/ethylmalonyl-CoA epimerase